MRNLNIVTGDSAVPALDEHGRPATVLVVSRERVGRVFAVQRLREHGLLTVVSDTAGQAVRRIESGHGRIAAVFVVGELADGTVEAYQRWLRGHGHSDLPLIAVGGEVDPADPFARSIDPRHWFTASADQLVDLGLLELPAADVAVAA